MKIIILRGVPGSGKSTYQNLHWPDNGKGKVIVCSADHYFLKDGVYQFDARQLDKAHAQCLERFAKHVVDYGRVVLDPEVLLVDNTNIHSYEVAPYYQLATAFRFPVEIHTIECDPEVAARRNVHGVPASAIERMARDLKAERLPRWWHNVSVCGAEKPL